MRVLLLLGVFLRVNVLGELAYRANFFVELAGSLIELATALAGLAVVFSRTDSLGGWGPDEMLALVGVYFLVGGAIGMVIRPAMTDLIDAVRHGTLDFTLTKPVDAQLLVSIRRVDLWKAVDIAMGAGVLVTAFLRLGKGLGWDHALSFVLMLACGAVIVYGFWLILASLSFWLVRMENILEIFQSVYQAGRWPVSLYPGWLRFAMTFIVPVAFAVTVPAQALTQHPGPGTLAGTAALAAALAVVSRLVWRLGLRHYSGASA
jgi:ABC-2 type transport system permease protein